MTARPLVLRVLFFREPHDPKTWVAQALEHDIAAYGENVEQAKIAFERTLSGYLTMATRRAEAPFATLGPAPDGFWDIWLRIASEQTISAEPIPSLIGHMMPVVSHEPVATAQ